MAGARKGIGQPETWVSAFKQGGVFLAFAVPCVGLIGMIAGAWSVKGEWGTAADWVQAIGSLIGIGIAIAVPMRLHTKDKEAERRVSMREDHQKALVALKATIEVESFLKDLSTKNDNSPHPWRDSEHYRARAQLHLQRIAGLLAIERNAAWWNVLMDAQEVLAELDAALRCCGVDDEAVRRRAFIHLQTMKFHIKIARESLDGIEAKYRDVLCTSYWDEESESLAESASVQSGH